VETVSVQMHGVRLDLSSEFAPLPQYVSLHLPHHVSVPVGSGRPDIEVLVRWRPQPPGPMKTDARSSNDGTPTSATPRAGLDRVGKRLFVGPGELLWTETVRVEGLSMHFRLDAEHLRIEADYVYAPPARKLDANPHYLERKLFSLTSWFVLHPLAWYLEHFRGLLLLHASGVEFDGRGIVIAGLGGVGKTTTAVSLVAAGGRMLAENLLFFDADGIYSCHEPIRLDAGSVGLLSGSPGLLEPTRIPAEAKSKQMYHLHRNAIADRAPGALLLIPRFTTRTDLVRLETGLCAERLLAMNGQTREVDDFEWFAAALNVAWPTTDSLMRRAGTLQAFLDGMECFDLGIDRTRGVAPVTQIILRQLRSAGEREEHDSR